jgi:hypothetical protein
LITEGSIAAVTAVLKSLLGNCLVAVANRIGIGEVNMTALPPDRLATSADERSQLNIFMYRIGAFSALTKNAPPPMQAIKHSSGNAGCPSAPLLVELSYLITAYAAEEFHSEILLGAVMQLLHETPVLTPEKIRGALEPLSAKGNRVHSDSLKAAIAASDLANQVQQVKIAPQFLSFEDMSKLWSALQARYRPSMCYQVSAVMIGGHAATLKRTESRSA